MPESYSVPVLSILFMAVSCLLSLGVPAALAIFCARRRRSAWLALGIGAMCFVLFALVLEGTLNSLVAGAFPALLQSTAGYVAYGALAAGLFEETARLIGLRWLCKRDAGALTGFAYGIGHGGVEAMLIGGMGSVNQLLTSVMLNAGQTQALLDSVPQDQLALAHSQLAALADSAPALFLVTGLERMAALCLHIALSVLVWMVVTRRLPAWGWAAAVLLHAATDVFAALYQRGVITSVWVVELLVFGMTGLACLAVWQLWRRTAADA